MKFLGATRTVTGSKTLIEYQNTRYLIDCGLFQGPSELRQLNWQEFEGPDLINSIILTHAHIDHSGYLPKIYKEGFKGKIFSSIPTYELCKILLPDSAYLQEEDAKFARITKHSRYENPMPLYTIEDAEKCLKSFEQLNYREWKSLSQELSFQLIRSGHIIGSSYIQFSFQTESGPQILTFSGDVSNNRSLILRTSDPLLETDYLVLESTYGDRGQDKSDPLPVIQEIVDKVTGRGGTLIIPSFAVGRTQEILYLLSKCELKIPVYLDSPMAMNATKIYKKFSAELKSEFLNDEIQNSLQNLNYKEINSTDESMLLCMSTEPKIVISAAGMLTGGRVLHHLKSKLPDPKSGVLFVGYQGSGTKGFLIKNGINKIRLHHKEVDIDAEIFSIDNLSAHADSNDLVNFVKKFSKKPKTIFLNHGEETAIDALAYRIKNELGINNVIIPKYSDEFYLE